MDSLPKPPPVPCGTCPYRRDVPAGIWEHGEYAQLPGYDGTTLDQLLAGATPLFMCHQQDGCLCGGWLLTHDREHLLALRLHPVDPSAYTYDPDTPVWPSGAAAYEHGVSGIETPTRAAQRKIDGLLRKRAARERKAEERKAEE